MNQQILQIIMLLIGSFFGAIIIFFVKKGQSSGILQNDYDNLKTQNIKLISNNENLEKESSLLKVSLANFNEKIIKLEKQNSSLEATSKHNQELLLNKENDIKKIQNDFKVEFENLSNRIFEDKQNQFTKVTSEKLGDILNPLKENIASFKKDINDKYIGQNSDRSELKAQIDHMLKAQAELSQGAKNLTNALKGENKTQGNWGEMILDNILAHSGLSEPNDYIREGKGLDLKNDSGKHMKPDVIVNLPEGKCLIIDSKVSLTNYERYCSHEIEEEKQKELVSYISSIKNHIKGLSEKKYQHLDKLTTPEFVLMFMPIEGAFSLAISNDLGLFEYAWDKKIILVCPSTLLATLKTTASVWKFEKQQKNAVKIAEQAGKLYDKFHGFLNDLQEIKKQFKKVDNEFDNAFNKLNSGRGHLIGQVEKLKELGAKASKQIDQNLLE